MEDTTGEDVRHALLPEPFTYRGSEVEAEIHDDPVYVVRKCGCAALLRVPKVLSDDYPGGLAKFLEEEIDLVIEDYAASANG